MRSPASAARVYSACCSSQSVQTFVTATPWPYNVYVHLAAWSGLRAAELCGLQIGDVDLPPPPRNPNARTKPGMLRVERTARVVEAEMRYLTPKTKGSRRRVPMTAETTELVRAYLAAHPRADTPTAPLFLGMVLGAYRPTGLRAVGADGKPDAQDAKRIAARQASALAELTVEEAAARLDLHWDEPLKHMTFYKAVYRPAVIRAGVLAPELKFHSLRHTYASLCVAAGIPPLEIARFMGHAKVTTTLTVYAHLFEDDYADAMTALGGMSKQHGGNVISLHG